MSGFPVRFDMNGLDREHREMYRAARKAGFQRHDANLIVFGAVLFSRGFDEITATFPDESRLIFDNRADA